MSTSPIGVAQGQRVALSYVKETVRGTTPGTPTMKTLRSTQRNINAKKAGLNSAEIRSDRQVGYFRHGFETVEGPGGFELSSQSYDDMLESLLGGAWAAVSSAGTPNLAAASSTNQFTRATGSFVTDGFRPGDIIVTTGFSNSSNNGLFLATVVSATQITVDGTLTTESSGSGKTLNLKGKRLDVGTNLDTYTIERLYQDITKYQLFRGVSVNSMQLNVKPEGIVGGSFEFLGMIPDAMTGTSLGVPTAAPATQPMAAFEGKMYEAGARVAVVTGIDFRCENGNQLTGVVGYKTSPDVFQGTFKASGTYSAMLISEVLFMKFLNETLTSLYTRIDDPDGNFLNIVIPSAKYTGDEIDPAAQGPVIQSLPWAALVDPVSGTSMSIQRSNT